MNDWDWTDAQFFALVDKQYNDEELMDLEEVAVEEIDARQLRLATVNVSRVVDWLLERDLDPCNVVDALRLVADELEDAMCGDDE